MIKLYTDEGWPNFSEDDGILSTGAPIIFIWGGRGTGKTYGAIKHVHEKRKIFVFASHAAAGGVDLFVSVDVAMVPAEQRPAYTLCAIQNVKNCGHVRGGQCRGLY